jgi:hypothetical protein
MEMVTVSLTPLLLKSLGTLFSGIEGVSKSYRTSRLERELQMLQLSAPGAVVSLLCEPV